MRGCTVGVCCSCCWRVGTIVFTPKGIYYRHWISPTVFPLPACEPFYQRFLDCPPFSSFPLTLSDHAWPIPKGGLLKTFQVVGKTLQQKVNHLIGLFPLSILAPLQGLFLGQFPHLQNQFFDFLNFLRSSRNVSGSVNPKAIFHVREVKTPHSTIKRTDLQNAIMMNLISRF